MVQLDLQATSWNCFGLNVQMFLQDPCLSLLYFCPSPQTWKEAKMHYGVDPWLGVYPGGANGKES